MDRNEKAASAPPPSAIGTAPDASAAPAAEAIPRSTISRWSTTTSSWCSKASRSRSPRARSALLGANGAGKSTTLKAISNLLAAERGEVTKGSIVFGGGEVHALTPSELRGAAASR